MRSRVVVLAVAAVALAFAAACGSDPAPTPPSTEPVAPVAANGGPVTSYCDLLTAAEITEVTGLPATAPAAAPLASPTKCTYGSNLELIVVAEPSVGAAESSYGGLLQTPAFSTVLKQGPIGGVDESVYAMGQNVTGLGLRRQKLVISITLPGTPDQAEVKLIQLAGRLLSRANSLGT